MISITMMLTSSLTKALKKKWRCTNVRFSIWKKTRDSDVSAFCRPFFFVLLMLSCHCHLGSGALYGNPTLVDVESGYSIAESLLSKQTENRSPLDKSSLKNNATIKTSSDSGLALKKDLVAPIRLNPAASTADTGDYFRKLNHLERSVATVLNKGVHGTSSTTKRSMSESTIMSGLTTVATPLLTTVRYMEKSPHQQINLHHRNYELDLERDHALPTSAPNADILKSNSNPSYPNPNRHHSLERHRHFLNSSSLPPVPNAFKKDRVQSPTIPMYMGEVPSYSPPARSLFTPPLPPEYQNPFADKPTLRGTNNEGVIASTGTYINRRPIPPPSLMPGHERIPFRPPDLLASMDGVVTIEGSVNISLVDHQQVGNDFNNKKTLNTPSYVNMDGQTTANYGGEIQLVSNHQPNNRNSASKSSTLLPKVQTHHEVLPSIRRILSGSNGNRGEIPEVLLKQVSSRPSINYHQTPASPVVLLDSQTSVDPLEQQQLKNNVSSDEIGSNINQRKTSNFYDVNPNMNLTGTKSSKNVPKSTASVSATIIGKRGDIVTSTLPTDVGRSSTFIASSLPTTTTNKGYHYNPANGNTTNTISGEAAIATAHATLSIAWNLHVYLSVILFTILAVYSLYKLLTFNKLTHLLSQSYFLCTHLILIFICLSRIFYLCYDAYNINRTFNFFVFEILQNLPATFLTISFSVLILFLFLKSRNHKNNRYSVLVRPLTVVIGCGVHVVLCITLHYVESYTMENQLILYHQQKQQQYSYRQQQHLLGGMASAPITTIPSSPPRVLSLICQIIFIFICLTLGLMYLYMYRILKRILRSKSQNYIHGYQNLSYAIHITIATALLFVLLAALQVFGAISIPTTRPLVPYLTADIDWLQWGYQFSLRLIEIAIITLISWVAGLKTSSGGGNSSGNGSSNVVMGHSAIGRYGSGGGILSSEHGGANVAGTMSAAREKYNPQAHHYQNRANVAGFFLPCTSSSSQDQFEADYPVICNANTNLHTYTMRTGKLIYDDSFALNSLRGGIGCVDGSGSVLGRNTDFQHQQQTYHHPYDNKPSDRYFHDSIKNGNQSQLSSHPHNSNQYAEYLTTEEKAVDHYENPNFDLRCTGSINKPTIKEDVSGSMLLKSSTTILRKHSSSGSSVGSQQQVPYMPSENCYSEPLPPSCRVSSSTGASNYDFTNFERPQFDNVNEKTAWSHGGTPQGAVSFDIGMSISSIVKKKPFHTLMVERSNQSEKIGRQSNSSTHSCASNRYFSSSSFERRHCAVGSLRKSGTLNNISGGDGISGTSIHCRKTSSSVTSSISAGGDGGGTGRAHRPHQAAPVGSQRKRRIILRGLPSGSDEIDEYDSTDFTCGRATIDLISMTQLKQEKLRNNSDDDEDEDVMSGCNVEHTNLIRYDDGSCITPTTTNSSIITSNGNLTDQGINNSTYSSNSNPQSQPNSYIPTQDPHVLVVSAGEPKLHGRSLTNSHPHVIVKANTQTTMNNSLGHDSAICSNNSNCSSSTSTTSSSTGSGFGSAAPIMGKEKSVEGGCMLIAELGFVRFRALDDINNAQGVGIHNASIRSHQTSSVSVSSSINEEQQKSSCIAQKS